MIDKFENKSKNDKKALIFEKENNFSVQKKCLLIPMK